MFLVLVLTLEAGLPWYWRILQRQLNGAALCGPGQAVEIVDDIATTIRG